MWWTVLEKSLGKLLLSSLALLCRHKILLTHKNSRDFLLWRWRSQTGGAIFVCRGSITVGPINLVNPPKPGLKSRALCGTVCNLSIANSTLINWPIVSLLLLLYFILFTTVFFCILVHDYTVCFIRSPCCSDSYYN